jgi:hypothetical protein
LSYLYQRGGGQDAPDLRISIKSTPKTFAAEMTKAFEALSQEPPLLFTFGPNIVRPETQRFKDSKGAVTYAHVLRIISTGWRFRRRRFAAITRLSMPARWLALTAGFGAWEGEDFRAFKGAMDIVIGHGHRKTLRR